MKKFIITVAIIIVAVVTFDTLYYRMGVFVDLHPDAEVTTFTQTIDDRIQVNKGDGFKNFEIKGVNMGSGYPGRWATEFKIDEETYLKWFEQIQEMGANTIRIYTVQEDTFYNAFWEYNRDNPEPLYMIHGVWVNDYLMNSHRDMFDKDIFVNFQDDCRDMIDIIHGNKKLSPGDINSSGSGKYKHDISQWVIGYILGVEWEDVSVAYTDHKYEKMDGYSSYKGKYMYTSDDATPFEALLAEAGDKAIEYETKRYKEQRLVAFSNWPTTDPFDYPENITKYYMKCAKVDVEHIKTTDSFKSGQFASYHVYPYYPDYLLYVDDLEEVGIENADVFKTGNGKINTYRAYLSLLTNHHSMPVLISEFGVSTGRGMAQQDKNTGRNQGNMSEKEQGDALIECYEDIMSVGCAGGCVFSWQDEWFKRTWNTMYAINMRRTPYWSDYQTNEQYFGLLSFDPGKKKSICYVDGDDSEWSRKDVVSENDSLTLSAKYDEKFIYFRVKSQGNDISREKLAIPLDITPNSGSNYCSNNSLKFERASDFIISLDGKSNSRLLVQERYEALRSTYSQNIWGYDTYDKDYIPMKNSSEFVKVNMILRHNKALETGDPRALAEVYETGKLTYGNANPESKNFNSLADFMYGDDFVEIKLPWQLLNFSDPSRMEIHDDYYDGNYGVSHINIDRLYAGIARMNYTKRIHMNTVELEGWDEKPTSHERLKASYYIMQKYWRDNN